MSRSANFTASNVYLARPASQPDRRDEHRTGEMNGAETLPAAAGQAASRVAWVDYAKGWCIVLVVTMHSALGVGLAVGEAGWLHQLVAFAKPFRMPDFFLIAGLFLGRAINLPWRAYLDRKVLHFVYFYALWFLIVLTVKSGELGILAPWPFLRAYLWGFVEPFSSMWFIQLLPLLFIAARLTRDWPPLVVIGAALALHGAAAAFPGGGVFAMNSVMTGSTTLNTFALFLVYFLIGHYARARILALAEAAVAMPLLSAAMLVCWALAEQLGVRFGLTDIPGLTIIFGLAGALAIVAVSALMARWRLASWLAYCGRHSLTIYLAFVLPMAATRLLLLKSGLVANVGWMSVIVASVAIAAPLALEATMRGTALAYLFKRPAWTRLGEVGGRASTQPDAARALS